MGLCMSFFKKDQYETAGAFRVPESVPQTVLHLKTMLQMNAQVVEGHLKFLTGWGINTAPYQHLLEKTTQIFDEYSDAVLAEMVINTLKIYSYFELAEIEPADERGVQLLLDCSKNITIDLMAAKVNVVGLKAYLNDIQAVTQFIADNIIQMPPLIRMS